jgi:beta-fructofuranosidase
VFSGSATILPDGLPVLVYTGVDAAGAQRQCIARPQNSDDPLLVNWTKSDSNPVIAAPHGVPPTEFRDDTTAWMVRMHFGAFNFKSDGKFQVAVGAQLDGVGAVLRFASSDFASWQYEGAILSARDVAYEGGMWEWCGPPPPPLTRQPGHLPALLNVAA